MASCGVRSGGGLCWAIARRGWFLVERASNGRAIRAGVLSHRWGIGVALIAGAFELHSFLTGAVLARVSLIPAALASRVLLTAAVSALLLIIHRALSLVRL